MWAAVSPRRSESFTPFETASLCCFPAASIRLASSQASRNTPVSVTHLPMLGLEVTNALGYTGFYRGVGNSNSDPHADTAITVTHGANSAAQKLPFFCASPSSALHPGSGLRGLLGGTESKASGSHPLRLALGWTVDTSCSCS